MSSARAFPDHVGGARTLSFLVRPRWLLSHLLILVLVIVMVNLGLWQLRRLEERRDRNELISGRMDEPVVPVHELLDPADGAAAAEDVHYRRVTASGSYHADEEVLVRSRSFGGSPGAWVLTPLATADGEAVVVNRGWVPVTDPQGEVPEDAQAPDGPVEVVGLVYPTQERGRFGPTDPAVGELDSLARADLERLQDQVEPDLYPAYIQLTEQRPEQAGDVPLPLDPPELDEGPHLSYAVQWFIFATIAVVGYPLILRRVARTRHAEAGSASGNGRVPEWSDTEPQAELAPEWSDTEPQAELAPEWRDTEPQAELAQEWRDTEPQAELAQEWLPEMDEETRERILEATLTCVARRGMGGLRVEEVAREAGVGRATVYRYFSGGREQLVSETVSWEVGRFFARLAAAIDDAPDFRTRLERGLAFARRTLQEHEVLQQVLATEPERLVPRLAEMAPLLLAVTRAYLVPLLEGEDLRPGVEVEEAADYLARMILSLIDSPGSWDLDDPDQVRRLVDTQLLGGVLLT